MSPAAILVTVVAALVQLGSIAAMAELGPVRDCHPCSFSPGGRVAPYSFTFDVRTTKDGARVVAAILVVSGDGKVRQRLDVGEMMPVPLSEPFFLGSADLNFDGWRDLSLVTDAGASNEYVHYWLFVPPSGTYEDLGKHPTLLVDAKRHRITSHETGGMAGLMYETKAYAFVGDELVVLRSERQEPVSGSTRVFRREVRERKGNQLRLVKTETIKK